MPPEYVQFARKKPLGKEPSCCCYSNGRPHPCAREVIVARARRCAHACAHARRQARTHTRTHARRRAGGQAHVRRRRAGRRAGRRVRRGRAGARARRENGARPLRGRGSGGASFAIVIYINCPLKKFDR